MHRLQPLAQDCLRAALAGALRDSGELRFLHRLHAVLLVSVGQSCYAVARWFGENPRTIERWVHAYETYGEGGLREHHHGGRQSALTPLQIGSLQYDLATPPPACGFAQPRWSGKLLARHIETRFGVRLSLRQCQRLLQQAR